MILSKIVLEYKLFKMIFQKAILEFFKKKLKYHLIFLSDFLYQLLDLLDNQWSNKRKKEIIK